jgi:hypothetical protein
LYYVLIGNGAQSIGDYAFSGCSSIGYFSFGSQVQTIGAEAFSDCVAMTRLYSYCQQPPTCGASALADIDKWNCTLYIPDGTIDAYTAADQWMDFFFVEENSPKFTITWKNDDGSIIDQTEVSYGQTPTHSIPTKPSTEQYTYTFAGWTPEVVAATSDATYTATFTAEPIISTEVPEIQIGYQATKIIRNGQLIIIRDGVEYNAMGQEVGN